MNIGDVILGVAMAGLVWWCLRWNAVYHRNDMKLAEAYAALRVRIGNLERRVLGDSEDDDWNDDRPNDDSPSTG